MATDNFAKSVLNNAANSFTYLCVQVIQKRHFLAQIHINTTDINLKRNKQTNSTAVGQPYLVGTEKLAIYVYQVPFSTTVIALEYHSPVRYNISPVVGMIQEKRITCWMDF